MSDFERVLSSLEGVRRKGDTAMAICPAHADKSPSLSIKYRPHDDRVLINCLAQNCSAESILAAAGLTWSDLYPKDQNYKPLADRVTREEVKSAKWLLELVPIWSREGVAFTEKDRQDIYAAQAIINKAKRGGYYGVD